MEAELTKMDSRPDNLEVSEDASVDEAIPIDIGIAHFVDESSLKELYIKIF